MLFGPASTTVPGRSNVMSSKRLKRRSRTRLISRGQLLHDHQLVAAVVNHLHCDLAMLSCLERRTASRPPGDPIPRRRSRPSAPSSGRSRRRCAGRTPERRGSRDRCNHVSRNHAGTSGPGTSVSIHRRRVERVQTDQLDLPAWRAAGRRRLRLVHLDFGQAAHAEDLARAHVLQQVAHHQVGRCLNVGRGTNPTWTAFSIRSRACGWIAKPMT